MINHQIFTITRRYGKLSVIGQEADYKGWLIEIQGLEIELATMDWQEAENETKWSICRKAQEFGVENICDRQVEDVFGDRLAA